jgi:formylglycine-generating enzyme required for sulfatase activity/TolB-like protein
MWPQLIFSQKTFSNRKRGGAMLDLRFWLVALILCGLFSSTASAADFKKTKIAVLDFEQRGDAFKTQDMGGIVAEWFTTAMVKDGRFQVVERALLKQIIEEQKLGMSGLIDQGSTAQLGKILGVKTIISGSVLLFQDYVEVNARIINVNTGSIVAAENLRSTTPEKLKEAIENLTAKIVKNFPLTGYIVKKRESTVLIDLGASGGLQPGMDFIVFKEGEAIKHPKTGEVLDVEQIRTGKIRIVEIGANTATADILEVEPKQEIRYGQLVQSVRKLDAPTEEKTETPTHAIKSAPPQVKQLATADVATTPPAIAPEEHAVKSETVPVAAKPPETATDGYQRNEFLPGERDNLASGGQGPAMLPLPTGTFMMGSERFSEKPVHFVKIERPVWMMVTEVTFEEYEKFCLETGAAFPDDMNWGKQDRPVINVSWSEAHAYARWLSKQTGFTYRLPSESEWEWAAGAGSGTLYPWGNSFKPDLANCRACLAGGIPSHTLPTRSFPSNKFGFHDMAGNVWEWVEDCWVDNYVNASEDQSSRKFSGKCNNYTIRGGGWNSPAKQVGVTTRLGVLGDTRSNYIGFRLVKDPNQVVRPDETLEDALPSTMPRIAGPSDAPRPNAPKKTTESSKSSLEANR